MQGDTLNILLIEESSESSSLLYDALLEDGHRVHTKSGNIPRLFHSASELNPDMIIANVEAACPALLTQIKHINQYCPKPIIVFSKRGDSKSIDQAVEADVCAFIVDGLQAGRIKPVLAVALSRFNKYSRLKQELDKTRETLDNRKLIEKAKGLVMRERNCTEDEAYRMLRKLAMNENKKLVDVARNVIEVSSLLM